MEALGALASLIAPVQAKIAAGKSIRNQEALLVLMYEVVKDNKEMVSGIKGLKETTARLDNCLHDLGSTIGDLRTEIGYLRGKVS